MKKTITLEWCGDGPESSNPGQSATIEIDFKNFLDGIEDDEEYLASLEKETRDFAQRLAAQFDADSAMTDSEIKECDEAGEREVALLNAADPAAQEKP